LSSEHPYDISKALRHLVERHLLVYEGSGRGSVYRLSHVKAIKPDDVFGEKSECSPDLEECSQDLEECSPDLEECSPGLEECSPGLEKSSTSLKGCSASLEGHSTSLSESSTSLEGRRTRNPEGLLISPHHSLDFVDDLDALTLGKRQELEALADSPRKKKKIPKEEMVKVLMPLCEGHYITLASLAVLVNRSPQALRDAYLTPLRKERKLLLAFPDTPNDSRQAYTLAP